MRFIIFSVLVVSLLTSCTNEKARESNRRPEYHVANVDRGTLEIQKKVYVPVYSDIYYRDSNHTFSLTATLSIRNTSFNDSIYLFAVDYYNSQGNKIQRYNESVLMIKPMESIEFVVEDKDNAGGVGANFVVEWGSGKGSQSPFIQGIMIGTTGQQGISFTTEGIEIQ